MSALHTLFALRYRAKIALVVAGLCFAFATVPQHPWIVCARDLHTGRFVCSTVYPPPIAPTALTLGGVVAALAAYSFARAYKIQRRLAWR